MRGSTRRHASAAFVLAGLLCASVPAAAERIAGARDAGPAEADEPVGFDIDLPHPDPEGLARLVAEQQDWRSPSYQHWLSPAELRRRFAPSAGLIMQIMGVLEAAGLHAVPTGHGVRVDGPAGAVGRLFATTLHHARAADGSDRLVAPHGLAVPPSLAKLGGRIAAFDPQIRMHALARRAARPQNGASTTGPYRPNDLREAYHAVSATLATGAGRTIGILIDADVLDSDMAAFFKREGVPPPRVDRVEIGIGHGYTGINGDSFEASLDVQQAFGTAPGASIILYVLQDLSDQSIMAGLRRAIADNRADIVSMSFGGCEATYTAPYNNGVDQTQMLTEYDEIFTTGNALGMTFVTASGDYGALECPPPAYFNGQSGSFTFGPGASTPATDPAVTAVGGTNLVTDHVAGSRDSSYVRENARNDPLEPFDPFGFGTDVADGVWGSGGGPSIFFRAPVWQGLVATGTVMRATPDLALHMGGCPEIAYATCLSRVRSSVVEWIGGERVLAIGTSAAAPDFAGVLALMEQVNGGNRLGNINPLIYQMAQAQAAGGLQYFHQAIGGDNGVYASRADGSAPYNMVVGNGSVKISNFIGAHGAALAGVPGSPSNP